MALIALNKDQSVTTSGREFKKKGSAVLIEPADMGQFKEDSKDCNSGYDLRVGGVFRDHRYDEVWQEIDDDGIRLLPGNAVVIVTQEWVGFPEARFGEIFPKIKLLQKGVANIPTKIDPGFEGYLHITVTNYGRREESLRRGERFCSLHVFNVEGPVRAYGNHPTTIAARQAKNRWRRTRDWIDANSGTISTIAAIASAIALVVSALK